MNPMIARRVHLAGLWEGKGTVKLTLQGDRPPRLEVRIITTHHALAEYLRDQAAGSITKMLGRSLEWKVTHASAREFLREIRPYCRVRGDEIDAALKTEQTDTVRRRSSYVRTIQVPTNNVEV